MDSKIITNNNLIDSKDIRNTIVTIGKNWYWFLLFLLLGTGGAIGYLYKATKYYGATCEILVKPPKDPFKDALSESLPLPPKKEDVANEIKILRSTKMIEETINKLNLDVSYFISGLLKTGEVYKRVPFTVDGKVSDRLLYGTPFSIKIIDKDKYQVEINTEGVKFSKTARFGQPVIHPKFSFIVENDSEIIKQNPNIADINYTFVFNERQKLIQTYQAALTIEKDDAATVINASIEDPVPEKAVDFLSTLSNLYIENSVSVNVKVNDNTLQFIEGQLHEVEAQLNNVEGNLEQFQREKTTINISQEGSMLFQRSIDFDSEKAKLSIQLRSIDQMYEYLTAANSDNLAISPAILAESNDNALSTSFNELFALQQKRTNLLFSNTATSPLVREADMQILNLKANMQGIVLNLRKSLVNKINSLTSQVGEYQAALRMMPSTQRGLVNINRNVEIYSQIYKFLLETRAQTIIAKAGIVADKVVIEPAYSTGLIRPLFSRTLFIGIGGGLALAFLVIFMKGIFMNYINTKDDLKAVTNLPIVGVIGKSKEADDDYLIVDKFPQSQISEAFRVIRTNLSYIIPKIHSKVILVTSSVAGEGKTFCAVNTASILAKAKKKVILIDLDLHKPKQANAFNLQNDIGVTSYIVGKASLKEIIKSTSVENLQVVLTGPRTPNASELLLDPMMEQLINELRELYDYIIIDTPPVGLLSDALVVMKHADMSIFVLKAGFSKKDYVDIAHQIVDKNSIKHLTFILNGVNNKNIPAGYGGGYYA